MYVTSVLCGPRADLWPFYGFLISFFIFYRSYLFHPFLISFLLFFFNFSHRPQPCPQLAIARPSNMRVTAKFIFVWYVLASIKTLLSQSEFSAKIKFLLQETSGCKFK